MAKNKTTYTSADVVEFVNTFAQTEQKRADSFELIKLMTEISGQEPKMWGPSIIGFGNYHYQYASGHQGDAPILGFSPRKAAISLYVYSDTEKNQSLLHQLGKCKITKGCLYINKLTDIQIPVLQEICKESIRHIKEQYGLDKPE